MAGSDCSLAVTADATPSEVVLALMEPLPTMRFCTLSVVSSGAIGRWAHSDPERHRTGAQGALATFSVSGDLSAGRLALVIRTMTVPRSCPELQGCHTASFLEEPEFGDVSLTWGENPSSDDRDCYTFLAHLRSDSGLAGSSSFRMAWSPTWRSSERLFGAGRTDFAPRIKMHGNAPASSLALRL